MDFEEYAQANWKRLEGQTREFVEDAFEAGQQSKQAEIDALKSRLSDIYDASDENETVAHLLDEIQELLK